MPSSSLPYSNSAAGTQGSWLALDTTAQGTVPCTVGGGVGATTGALVTISGMTGTYSSTTGTRVSSATSSCGVWTLDVAGPPMKAPVLKPSVQPSSHPITPVAPTRPTVHPPVTTYTFLSIGDWGGAAIDAGIYHNVYAVAAQLKTSAVATNAKFVIGLGDNFYCK